MTDYSHLVETSDTRCVFEQGAIWATRIARGSAVVPEVTVEQRLAILYALNGIVRAHGSQSAGMKAVLAGETRLEWPALTLADIEIELNFPEGYLRGEAVRDVSPKTQSVASDLQLIATKLDRLSFYGTDQNPFGIRDLLGSAAHRVEMLEAEVARLRDAAKGATVITNQASDTIKKQGVRIAHLEVRSALLAEVTAVLDKIMTCELVQRVGGPDPDDLQALDNALTEAVTLACTLRDRIAATPVPEPANG